MNTKKLISASLIITMLGASACNSGAGQAPSTAGTAGTVETTEFTWNDSPEGNMVCFIDAEGTDDNKEMAIAGYKSGTDPVFLLPEAEYETNGKGSGLYDIARNIPSKITDESLLNITKDLNLSPEVDGIPVVWRSSDESLLESSGKVHRPHDRSRYVLLEAHFAKGEGYMTSRYALRIARDMYADTDPDSLPLLAHDGRYHEPPAGTEGEWFVFDTMNQINRFDPKAEVMVSDYSHDSMRSFTISGRISMPRVDTEGEAFLTITTLGKILHSSHAIKNLEFKDAELFSGDMKYDYIQKFKGVPVVSSCVRVISSFRRPYTTVVFNMVLLPDDFSVKADVPQTEIEEKYGLDHSELVIWEYEGKPWLVYHGFRPADMTEVYIDAKNGVEIYSQSVIMT